MSSLINCSIVENSYLHLIFLFVYSYVSYVNIIMRYNIAWKSTGKGILSGDFVPATSEEFARDSDVFVTLLTRN